MRRFFVLFGELIYCVFNKLNAKFSSLFRAVYSGYQMKGMKAFDSSVSFYYPTDRIVGREYISVGSHSSFGKRAVITAFNRGKEPEITIGKNVMIGDDCHITAVNKIVIGNNVQIAKKVTISDNSHGRNISIEEMVIHPAHRETFSKGAVIIGDNVWIADKVTICPDVTVGDGAVIGANSVVTKDVPAYSVVAGIPAREIRSVKK